MLPIDPLKEVLARVWGFSDFRPLQREAMEAVSEGRDCLVVLPTGGGKSVCFQAPALVGDGGLAVVVSPLISLMKDQVDALVGHGVAAAYYNSSQTQEEQNRVLAAAQNGDLSLLYVSPERLVGESSYFVNQLRGGKVRYLAIDEAHCISHWGHDFRPEYRELGRLRELWPGISVHAFTATATERVRQDIGERLGLREPLVLVGSFDRPNLVFRAQRRQQVLAQVRQIVAKHPGEGGIVYCISRKEVERIAAALVAEGVKALPYHAGLEDQERKTNQDAFIQEKVDVIVATVAFGMGIDRSNVRYVAHAGAPKSLEHYQQEAGRAGRDGLPADCTLFYSPGDFLTWRRLLEQGGELSDSAVRQLREMERYAASTRCRHRALVEYFGESFESESCGACDWCLGELEKAEEPVVLAQKILSCVLRLEERWGTGQVVDVLRGRTTEKVTSRGHDQLSTFGLLEDCPVHELRGYVDQLVGGEYLALAGDRYPTLTVTPEGWRLLRAEIEVSLFRQRQPEPKRRRQRRAAVAEEAWEGVDRELFEKLRDVRLEIARERGVPPYVIFHDTVLRRLARDRPRDRLELLDVPGVGEKKADDLGPRFLAAIAQAEDTGGSEIPLEESAAEDDEGLSWVDPRARAEFER